MHIPGTTSSILRTLFVALCAAALLGLAPPATAQVDLTLQSSQTEVEIQPDGMATTTVTLTLENTDGSTDATNVAVDVSVPSGLSVSSSTTSSGSYGSGTWDAGTVAAATSETLDLTITLSNGSTPQDLSAQLSSFDQSDPNGASANARIIPAPGGSGKAPHFGLSGNVEYIEVPFDPDVNGSGPIEKRTIELWFKADNIPSDLTDKFLYHEGAQDDTPGDGGFTIYLSEGKLYAGFWSEGASSNGQCDDISSTWLSTTSVKANTWHHVALVFDNPNDDARAYLDGEKFGQSSPSNPIQNGESYPIGIGAVASSSAACNRYYDVVDGSYDGQIDEVRVWDTIPSQQTIQERAHRPLDLDNTTGLLAAFRFDTGTGTTVYDVAGYGGNYVDGFVTDGTQWEDLSLAGIGSASQLLTDTNSPVTVGPSGSSIEGQLTNGTGVSNDASLFRAGTEGGSLVSGETFPVGVSERSNVTWGAWNRGSATTTLTFDYADLNGIVKDGSKPVRLLRRGEGSGSWTDVTDNGNVSHDTGNDVFTASGVTGKYRYAVANATYIDFTLSASLPSGVTEPVELGAGEQTTVTFTLKNTDGTDDATNTTVDVTVPSGLSVENSSATSGSYSSGTWNAGTIAAGTQATLDLTVAVTGTKRQSVTAQLQSFDGGGDRDGASTNGTRLLPTPYGSGRALVFDGSSDYVTVADDPNINSSGPYAKRTVELWFKASNPGASSRQVIFEEGDANAGLNIYLKSGTLYAGAWDGISAQKWLTTSSVQSGTWHHVALVFDGSNTTIRAYLDGKNLTSISNVGPGGTVPSDLSSHNPVALGESDGSTKFSDPTGTSAHYFEGRVDQVRLWDAVLTHAQIVRRARRSIDLDGSVASNLLAAFRLDAGSGTTAYDAAGFSGTYPDGTFQGDPQWASFSGAPLGRKSAALTDGQTATLGPSGGSVSVSNVSTTSGDADPDTLQVYQYGRTDGPTLTSTDDGEDFSQVSDVSKRLHVVWGFGEIGGVSADVTLDYSGVEGLATPENVRLLKRSGPGQPWQDVSGNWTWDETARTFSKSGLSSFSQYAIGEASSALPVELASFEGTMVEDGVRLTWQTASEESNARFEIERRAEESDWTQVGAVEGEGTTDEPQRYRFRDEEIPYAADSVRYRLRQVDLDGTAHVSEPVVVDRGAVEELQLLGTAPNPVRRRATVRFAIPEGTEEGAVEMRLYDVLGRQVRTVRAEAKPGRHELELDVSGLGSGTYFLRLQGEQAAQTQKVVIVR